MIKQKCIILVVHNIQVSHSLWDEGSIVKSVEMNISPMA
jgi:hypothetical protein